MKLWTKWALIISATVIVAIIAAGVILVRRTQKLLPDLYAQWATAELVITYYKDKHEMPPDWDALKVYFPDSAPHRGDLSFDEIRNRISINFPALPVLTKTFPEGNPIPEIITAKSGTDAHWQGAEPNELVNATVRERLPHAPPFPMEDPMFLYEIFNRIEGLAWFGVAIGLPFYLKPKTRRQRLSIAAASGGFILFGTTDFLEAPLRGQLPAWLWIYKIACAALILACRFFYIGWDRFRLTDRFVLFGVFCLLASLGAISLQRILYGS